MPASAIAAGGTHAAAAPSTPSLPTQTAGAGQFPTGLPSYEAYADDEDIPVYSAADGASSSSGYKNVPNSAADGSYENDRERARRPARSGSATGTGAPRGRAPVCHAAGGGGQSSNQLEPTTERGLAENEETALRDSKTN